MEKMNFVNHFSHVRSCLNRNQQKKPWTAVSLGCGVTLMWMCDCTQAVSLCEPPALQPLLSYSIWIIDSSVYFKCLYFLSALWIILELQTRVSVLLWNVSSLTHLQCIQDQMWKSGCWDVRRLAACLSSSLITLSAKDLWVKQYLSFAVHLSGLCHFVLVCL